MSRAPSLCGVILAAGSSTRMGQDKALLPWPPLGPGKAADSGLQNFLSAAIEALSSLNDMVIVVSGKNASNLEAVVYANGAFLLVNPDPDRGQFSSLQVGLQEVLNRGRDAAMITLVDRPPPAPATLARLRTAFEMAVASGKWAIIPEYAGKHGHPIVIGREMIEVFLKAPASASARDVEHQHQQHIEYVSVADPFVTVNINTPEDYASLASVSLRQKR